MTPIELYLQRIRREATGRLSPDATEALLAEVRTHLEAAALQVDLPPLEAEQKAIEQFGDPKRLVLDLVPPRHTFDIRFFRRVGASSLAVFLAGYFGWHLGFRELFMWLVLIPLGVGLVLVAAWESFRARRIQLVPIAALYALTVALGALGEGVAEPEITFWMTVRDALPDAAEVALVPAAMLLGINLTVSAVGWFLREFSRNLRLRQG